MTRTGIETALMLNADRYLSPGVLGQVAKSYQASGVVDFFHVADQMNGWWPPHLWSAENTPLAAVVPDPDSSGDAVAVLAYASALAPGMGVTVSTDAIRRGPAEMMQTMLTLANMSGGRAVLQLGAGEIKQTLSYGWKRSEGLKRQEDHLRYYDAFWKGDGSVSLQGNCWTFDQAWIGGARQSRPRVYALGGGPKLIELATSYADGFASVTPNVFSTPEAFGRVVSSMRQGVHARGRDPAKFDFCLWAFCLIHDDPNVISRALDNPLFRWLTAIYGRMNMADWAAYGETAAFPLDWHYSTKFIPNRYTDRREVDGILGRVTRRMCEQGFLSGSAADLAAQIQPYIEAGATCIDVVDMLPLVLDPADAQAGLGRQLDLCARIKRNNP
jgi:phthiodiolone/phenolphthiodiolone dimycocerosates ketoreductase